MFIDNAYNFPDIDSPKRLLNPSNEMFIALTPERTYATSGIKAFPPDQRQCFFQDEVRLLGIRLVASEKPCICHTKRKGATETRPPFWVAAC